MKKEKKKKKNKTGQLICSKTGQFNLFPTEIFTHLDGSVRIYGKSDYEDRICCQNLKNCNKSYHKAKIFRIDGEIDYEAFRHVVGAFYKWNRMPIEYFERSA